MGEFSRRDSKAAMARVSHAAIIEPNDDGQAKKHTIDSISQHHPLPDIVPKRVLKSHGDVECQALPGIRLTNGPTGTSEVVLDYGRAEGGNPIFEVLNASSESDTLDFQVVYSETIREIDSESGDGPFFLFSNAMDSYRAVTHSIAPSSVPQTVRARYPQRSQRYQKLRLLTSNASIHFGAIGFTRIRPEVPPKATFSCSDPLLNKIWQQGARTVDLCTVQKGETEPAWDVADEGTMVYGQHWAPCRRGTRWRDKIVEFEVKVDKRGASWGVHMVANGLVFCLDVKARKLEAFEGLASERSVFPTIERGKWDLGNEVDLEGWVAVETRTMGNTVSVALNGRLVAEIEGLDLHPLLGGSANNSGSIAFGGPNGWISTYRNLVVTDGTHNELYRNTMRTPDQQSIFDDFAVGTNSLACTMDGAKRDRATFGGDLHIMGRSIAYSTQAFEAVRGSIELLASHQTKEGYLGNLCPIQAPVHDDEGEEPPTYAFYSLTYALLLVVAIKDYWMHTGDHQLVRDLWPKLTKLKAFAESFMDERGLIAAPPPLSLTFFPLIGPVFGVSTQINLAFVDALRSMARMAGDEAESRILGKIASGVEESIRAHLWDEASGILRLGDQSPSDGLAQDVNGYGISLGVSPKHGQDLSNLTQPGSELSAAFQGLGRFDELKLCSPYSSSFAIEACFVRDEADAGLDMIRRIWGLMANENNPDHSGCHWEALTLDGKPYHDTTSLVHGWSTSPIYLLPMYFAGLRPVEAGWRKWEARPISTSLSEVKASVPIASGEIKIDWSFDDQHEFGTVSCSGTRETYGSIYPPAGWLIEDSGQFSSQGVAVEDTWITRRLRRCT